MNKTALIVALAATLLTSGCATRPQSSSANSEFDPGTSPWAAASQLPTADTAGPWEHYLLPGKQATRFSGQHHHGRDALRAQADASASMVRRKLQVAPENLGKIKFSWMVEALNHASDMAQTQGDDAPVRIVLAFAGDRSNFSPRNAMLSELALLISGEPLPYATLMYSWCTQRTVGSTIVNPRTDRIRTLVLESGSEGLGRWRDYERDIAADFLAVFGEAPGPLVAVGVMTDADNTQSRVTAWYGPLVLVRN